MRDALDQQSTGRERARVTFRELADSAPEEDLHRESISRLAYSRLANLGNGNEKAPYCVAPSGLTRTTSGSTTISAVR